MRSRWHRLCAWWRPPLALPPWSLCWPITPAPPQRACDAAPPDDDTPHALLIVPHLEGPQDLAAMELTIQSLALAGPRRQQVIALELVGWELRRALLLRAAPDRLEYLATQLHARYPQSEVHPLTYPDDPFSLGDAEQVVARVLIPTGAPFASLRTWAPKPTSRQEQQVGTDPLLGILATLGPFPPGMRLIAQLALAPAAPTWSAGHQRLADQYTLAHAHQEAHSRIGQQIAGGDAFLPVVLLFPILVVLWWLLQPATHATHLPLIGAFLTAIQHTIHQHAAPGMTLAHLLPLLLPLVMVIAGGGIGITILLARFRHQRLGHRPVYDPVEVAQKTRQPGFHARLRLFAISPVGTDQRVVQQALDRVTAAYRQFHSAGGTIFTERRLPTWWATHLTPEAPFWADDTLHRAAHWTWRIPRTPAILSLGEVATLWHLPLPADQSAMPWLNHSTAAKTILAPQAVIAAPGTPDILGVSEHAGHRAPVTLAWETLRQHAFAIAKTGKGKSTLLLALARLALLAQDVSAGVPPAGAPFPGIVLIDPHGDLATVLLGCIPPQRQADVVVVDLGDTAHPCAFNPLDVALGRDRDKAVENLIAIFTGIWKESWGPRMGNVLSGALKTLYAANECKVHVLHEPPETQYTLLDVEPLLENEMFRHQVLDTYLQDDQTLLDWWHAFYDAMGQQFRLEVITPILTKLAQFSQTRIARRIVGQPQTTLHLTEIVTQGSILILTTAQGIVGAETARLVGATLLGALRVTIEEQVRRDPAARRRMLVLVDEFQALPGVPFVTMLAELRKFGAAFVLATQTLADVEHPTGNAQAPVLANCDALFCFAMSATDAKWLEGELDGIVTQRDLVNLPNYTCYAKLTVQGTRLPVFSLRLDPPPAGDAAQAARLRTASQAALAPRDAAEVDRLLAGVAAARPTAPRRRRRNLGIGTPPPSPPSPGAPMPAGGHAPTSGATPPLRPPAAPARVPPASQPGAPLLGAGIPSQGPRQTGNGTFAAQVGARHHRPKRAGGHHGQAGSGGTP